MASLRVRGTPGVLKALEMFEPELAKRTAAELSKGGRDIVKDAQNEIPDDPPMRGWRTTAANRPRGKRYGSGVQSNVISRGGAGWPAWQPDVMRRNIKSRRRDLRLTITFNEAAGNIFAIAGTKSGGRGTGVQFIRNLPDLTPGGGSRRRGRVMVPAVRRNYGRISDLITNELFDVIRDVNRKVS